jgi:hypothetical protein
LPKGVRFAGGVTGTGTLRGPWACAVRPFDARPKMRKQIKQTEDLEE